MGLRKVSGYLLLSAVFGGFFGAMSYNIGLGPAVVIIGTAAAALGIMELAIYLIWEGDNGSTKPKAE